MNDDQRIAMVTGAYGAIGQAIARGIADAGYKVVLAGRNPERLEQTRSGLVQVTGNPQISCEVVDLGVQREIRNLARRWKGPLHLLVNNAATGPRKRTETEEGIEVQWAVNVMGYFWMIHYMLPFMKGLSGVRIVNVASYWAGGMDMRDPEYRSGRYDNDAAYRQSKQADRMISAAYAERLKAEGITVNACHPGDVNSRLSNYFGFGGSETPEQGAATPLYLALSKETEGQTGKYFEHLQQVPDPFTTDHAKVEELFSLCRRYTSL